MYQVFNKQILFAGLVLATFVMAGCVKEAQSTLTSYLKPTFSAVNQNLYAQYSGKFPQNLMSWSLADYQQRWASLKTAKGNPVSLPSAADIAAVATAVNQSVPSVNIQSLASQTVTAYLVDLLAGSTPMTKAEWQTTLAGAQTELQHAVNAAVEMKLKIQAAQRQYILFSELAARQTTANAGNRDELPPGVAHSYFIQLQGIATTDAECWFLMQNPELAVPIAQSMVDAAKTAAQLFAGQPGFSRYGTGKDAVDTFLNQFRVTDSTQANAFLHAYWNFRMCELIGRIPASAHTGIRDSASILTDVETYATGHEDGGKFKDNTNLMDLHNNEAGRQLYARHAKFRPVMVTVEVPTPFGNMPVSIPVGSTVAWESPGQEAPQILFERALAAVYAGDEAARHPAGRAFANYGQREITVQDCKKELAAIEATAELDPHTLVYLLKP